MRIRPMRTTTAFGDACDACLDADQDSVCDDVDNCPNTANPGQEDSDSDGVGDACEPSDNVVVNSGFEDGKDSWNLYTSGTGSFDVASPGYEGTSAARIRTTTGGTNIQFYKYNVPLDPNTDYELRF